jgi:hypothetical protein
MKITHKKLILGECKQHELLFYLLAFYEDHMLIFLLRLT